MKWQPTPTQRQKTGDSHFILTDYKPRSPGCSLGAPSPLIKEMMTHLSLNEQIVEVINLIDIMSTT